LSPEASQSLEDLETSPKHDDVQSRDSKLTLIRGKTLNQLFEQNPRSGIKLDKLPPTLLQVLNKEPNEIFKGD